MRVRAGFTLIEMVVVIAVIAILAGALVPVITKPYIVERKNETVREMGQIEEAIAGRPDLGDYGYVGTMGRAPTSINELLYQGTQPLVSAPNGVPVGWNGPYLRAQTQDPTTDGWGSPYVLENAGNPNQWRIRSYGPDRQMGNGDDVVFPADGSPGAWWGVKGTVTLDVMIHTGVSTMAIPDAWAVNGVTLYYPNNGTQTSQTCSPGGGRCIFNNIPYGVHPVQVAIPAGTAGCPSGGCTFNTTVNNIRPQSYATATVSVPFNPNSANCGIAAATPPAVSTPYDCTSINLVQNQVVTFVYTGAARVTASGTTCYLALRFDNDPNPATYPYSTFNSAANITAYRAATVETTSLAPVTLSRTVLVPTSGTHSYGLFVTAGGSGNCALGNGTVSVYQQVPP